MLCPSFQMAFVWTIFNIKIPTLIGDFRVSVFSTLSTGDLHLKAPSWNPTPRWPATQGQTGEQSTRHKGGLCLFSLSACRAETQGSVVTGPGASQPPVVTNRPACLPGSQGAHLAPTWSQHPCPMFCPLTGHTEGPHTSEALLRDQLSPYIFCRVPSHCRTGPLSLVSGVAPWTPGVNPFCSQPSRPPATRPTWLARPPTWHTPTTSRSGLPDLLWRHTQTPPKTQCY